MKSKLIFDEKKFISRVVDHYLSSNISFLNFACGDTLIPSFIDKSQLKNAWGADKNNKFRKNKNIVIMDVDRDSFPFQDNYFDLALSIWGIEHFKTTNFLTKLRKCLKPRAHFVFMTPNLFYPVFLANKILPYNISNYLRKKVLNTKGNDPAYYRFNDYFTIKRKSKNRGFKIKELYFIGPANAAKYFPDNYYVRKSIVNIEKILTNRNLFHFKPIIVGVLKKIADS